ncbi:MAG: DNA primase [Patescibacteria group bacterium]
MTDLEEIKGKIDLVDFIGRYLPLKKAGTNYKGLCPFHMEKSPSFMVSPDKQIWHCFGCGRGGDVFKFVMEKEGMGFSEALSMLAEQTGIQLSKVPQSGIDTRKTLMNINETAARFYEKVLLETDEGRAAKEYMVGRGMLPATLAGFRIGFAPKSGRALAEFLIRKGAKEADIEKAGLGVRKGNFLYDKFVGRVMFPLWDSLGRVVAFTGRVLDPNGIPKYLNSPETPLFHKSEMLYGLHLAKQTIQQEGRVVMVEGQMDTISSYQAGVKNVVGISGTALTEQQLQMLNRYGKEIILSLDADAAGGEATRRALELANNFDMTVKVVLLGNHKDPDSMIKENPENWEKAVDAAVPVMDFYFDVAARKYDVTKLEDKKQLTRELLAVITKVNDPVERDHYIKRLARTVDVEPAVLYDALKKSLKPNRKFVKPAGESTEEMSPTWLEERVVMLPMLDASLLSELLTAGKRIKWASGLANTIYDSLRAWYTADATFRAEDFLKQLPEPTKTAVSELMLVLEQGYVGVPVEDLGKELKFYLDLLLNRSATVKRNELAAAIAEAEAKNDQVRVAELLKELNQL